MTDSDPVDGRKPKVIQQAVCGKCIQEDMISKPIYVQISVVYESQNPNVQGCCRCNMDVAVGCTCVNKQH
ncbi:hypothetical protein FQA47_011540 [Oryzias melastigma]|uniref:Uncharacterized protein n=1 Tax=Oryzias melastigma TaxID=30732 RepID=A0A834CCT1_ORYME|nr:hypothetical protein FQA47_011540 [Oryzias melastigma]